MNNWRLVTWTDEDANVVKRLACHVSELKQVLEIQPPGSVVREPVTILDNLQGQFFCRYPYKVGDTFYEIINQGERLCVVISVDETTGNYLYEYEMPRGRKFIRNQYGKPTKRK